MTKKVQILLDEKKYDDFIENLESSIEDEIKEESTVNASTVIEWVLEDLSEKFNIDIGTKKGLREMHVLVN